MKVFLAAVCGLMLAGCNQTSQTAETTLPSTAPAALASSGPTGGMPAGPPPNLPSDAQIAAATPLYEPVVDTRRVNPAKLRKDLLECRAEAAPHEAAARRAAQTQQTGTAIQTVGALASFIPVPGFRQAHVLAGATNALQSVGEGTAANAAETQERAMQGYVAVVNSCMEHRKYRLLQA